MSWRNMTTASCSHRYLMTRLSLPVVYLWRHVSSTAPPFILWWSNLELLFGPLHRSSPFIGELRCQAIQMELGLIKQREPKTQSNCEMSVVVPVTLLLWPELQLYESICCTEPTSQEEFLTRNRTRTRTLTNSESIYSTNTGVHTLGIASTRTSVQTPCSGLNSEVSGVPNLCSQ
jgi:hypothetical protein